MDTRRNPNTVCDLCKKPIYRRRSQIARQKGRFCSRSCRNKAYPLPYSNFPVMMGEKNPAWKGGVTLKRPKGNYKNVKYVRCPKEYLKMARKDGYVMEHRLVMAQHIGRILQRIEVVHHIDHNPANNNINNLMLFPTNQAHKLYEGGKVSAQLLNPHLSLSPLPASLWMVRLHKTA